MVARNRKRPPAVASSHRQGQHQQYRTGHAQLITISRFDIFINSSDFFSDHFHHLKKKKLIELFLKKL